jgi:hypothetical protein
VLCLTARGRPRQRAAIAQPVQPVPSARPTTSG